MRDELLLVEERKKGKGGMSQFKQSQLEFWQGKHAN